MALDATEVVVASDGHIYTGAVDAAPPTNVTTPVSTSLYTDLGYASEAGVKLKPNLTTKEVMAWQSITAVRRMVTGSSLEVTFALLQSNIVNLGLYLNATAGVDKLDIPRAPTALERALLIEWIDGGETNRLYIARAQLTATNDVQLARGDAVTMEMTWTAIPSGNSATPLATLLLPIPVVTATTVTPATGAQSAVVPITIAGTNFATGATVTVSGTGVTVSATSVVSPTSITATFTMTAGATLGARNVTVTNTDTGTGTATAAFTVTA
jgi:hypothetical protein